MYVWLGNRLNDVNNHIFIIFWLPVVEARLVHVEYMVGIKCVELRSNGLYFMLNTIHVHISSLTFQRDTCVSTPANEAGVPPKALSEIGYRSILRQSFGFVHYHPHAECHFSFFEAVPNLSKAISKTHHMGGETNKFHPI